MLAGSMTTTDQVTDDVQVADDAAIVYWSNLECHFCIMDKQMTPLPVVWYNPTTGDFVCMFHKLVIQQKWMTKAEWQAEYFTLPTD